MQIRRALEGKATARRAIGLAAAWLVSAGAVGQEVVFPADAGVVDVSKPPYNARGDGRTDDTAALQQALADHPNRGSILYLPRGTYVVSDTLKWPHGEEDGAGEKNTILEGQARDTTILRLKDGCSGFDDPAQPRALVWTGREPGQRFRSSVRNLTLDTGKDNPGAIGLQFMASNQGCVRDVTIRSSDGEAHVGLDLTQSPEIGPCLIKNVRILGFGYGIRTAHALGSITIENVGLESQRRFGLVNEGACLSVRGLTSRNLVTAVVNAGDTGHIALIDATLSGMRGASDRPAINNEAFLYTRNVTTAGYSEAVRDASGGRGAEGKRRLEEFVSHPVENLFPGSPHSLNLPIKETPEIPWDDLAYWVSPTHFGARPDDNVDDSEAIQKAIDSGKTTVYLPNGYYLIRDTVLLRKNVRRFIGCEATIGVPDLGGKPAFKIVDGASPFVLFERIQAGYSRTPIVENASDRTLVVRDCFNICGQMKGPGDVFLEGVSTNPFSSWRFGRQNVWARQLDVESQGTHIVNEGGQLWILGLKTARAGTLIETTGGGRTEVLGGLCHATGPAKTMPMFVCKEAALSVSIGESAPEGNPFSILVSETRGVSTKTLSKGEVPSRAGGSAISLFVSQAAER